MADDRPARAALICGSARSLFDDLDAWGDRDADLIAVNLAGVFLHRPIAHWVSCHACFFRWAPVAREQLQGRVADTVLQTYSAHSKAGAAMSDATVPLRIWDLPQGAGSGTFATRVALALGYQRIVLAGMPQTFDGYFYDPPGRSTQKVSFAQDGLMSHWRDLEDEQGDRIRSLSGRTRDLFGPPDPIAPPLLFEREAIA